jgi:hypothetical protein
MINFLNFLNEYDQDKMRLLDQVLSLPKANILIADLQTAFSFSEYKITNLLDSINTDVKLLTMKTAFLVQHHNVICGPIVTRKLFNQLKDYYFTLAPQNELLKAILKNGNFPSFKQMEINFGWNKPIFYQQKRKLQKLLAEFLQQQTRNEILLRYFFFNVLDFFNSCQEWQSKYFAAFTFLPFSLRQTQKRKLNLMLQICTDRISCQHFIDKKDLLIKQSDQRLDQLIQLLPALSQENSQAENIFFNQFLYHIGVKQIDELENQDFCVPIKQFSLAKQIIQKSFAKLLPQKEPDYSVLEAFSERTIHELALKTHNYILNNQFSKKFKYFHEVHPLLDQTVKNILKQLSQLQLDLKNNERIYFDIITSALLSSINFTSQDSVWLCIDFSGGDHVNTYISNLFKTYININVLLQQTVTKQTDIYLTDQFDPQLNIPQVIWLKPPTALDWAQIGDEIVAIKQQKFLRSHLVKRDKKHEKK